MYARALNEFYFAQPSRTMVFGIDFPEETDITYALDIMAERARELRRSEKRPDMVVNYVTFKGHVRAIV